jgi:hypothetical protein
MTVRKGTSVTEHEGRERGRGWTRISILTVGVLLVVGGIFGGLASTALAGHVNPVPSVRSPHDGHRLSARPALVKLYLGSARLVGARLNGRHIEDDLGRGRRAAPCVGTPVALTRGATCKLRASPSHGLRYGVNVLKARFKRHHHLRVRTVHFRVARHRPLAAAGRDQYVVPGSRVRLNGRASLMPPWLRQRLVRSGRRYRWHLVHAPGASHGKLTGAHTPTPSIKVKRHGKYKVRLNVTAPGGRTGSDSVTVWSANQGAQGSDSAPLVGVDTMATEGGQQGVELHTYRSDTGVPNCPKDIYSSLGFSCFYPDPGQGHEWVQLLVLNRQDLSLVANKPFYCNQATRTPKEYDFDTNLGSASCIKPLFDYVTSLNDNVLVIAVNQPGDGTNKKEQPPVGIGAALSGGYSEGDRTLNLGIGATRWLDAIRNGQDLPPAVRGTFSAIGVPGWKTGGISKLPQDPGSWDPRGSGRLETNIAVNNLARYAPFDPVDDDEAHSPLVKVLTKQSTPWPTATAGQAAALSAIGASDRVGLTSDPRAFYYTAKPTEDWAADLTAIDRLRYTDLGPSPGFTQDDFNWAQDELHREVFWITKVNTYVNALAMPYDGASKTLWSDFQKDVSDIVNTETSNGAGAKVWAGAKAVFEGLVDLIPGAGTAYKWSEGAVFAAEAIVAVYHTGVDFAELGGEPADSGFQTEAAELGKKLGDRLDEAETEIRVRFRNIIVADYGKLKTVALCSTSSSGCDDTQPGWSLTNNGVANMQTVLKMGLQREIFTELVPAKFPLALGLTPVTQSYVGSGLDASNWCQPVPPFEQTTATYLWPSVDWSYWRNVDPSERPSGNTTITPIVLTAGDPGLFATWKAASWTVFGRMFDPIDPSGNFDKGGLAINEAQFMTSKYGVTPGAARTEHFEYAPDASFPKGCHWRGT